MNYKKEDLIFVACRANYPRNTGQPDYLQAYFASRAGQMLHTIYPPPEPKNLPFDYPVIGKLVKAETGYEAIQKFIKWQQSGMPETELIN